MSQTCQYRHSLKQSLVAHTGSATGSDQKENQPKGPQDQRTDREEADKEEPRRFGVVGCAGDEFPCAVGAQRLARINGARRLAATRVRGVSW
eukprot:6167031-Pleurochrysis_carterae.AAC.3